MSIVDFTDYYQFINWTRYENGGSFNANLDGSSVRLVTPANPGTSIAMERVIHATGTISFDFNIISSQTGAFTFFLFINNVTIIGRNSGPLNISQSYSINLNIGDTLSIAVEMPFSSTTTLSNFLFTPAASEICFLEGTKILCLKNKVEQYIEIEKLDKTILVKTLRNGYKKIAHLYKSTINNPSNNERIPNRLYIYKAKAEAPYINNLTEDLILTGYHSRLTDYITDEQREELIKIMGRIFVTDNKYRLIACVDNEAQPWTNEGIFNIYHLALDTNDININFGIYANGLLVETCCIKTIKRKGQLIKDF
jgi:hypothetical protein